jgi:transcriptional regulator with XRE-family HTH domain
MHKIQKNEDTEMMRWDKAEYQRIASAERRGDDVVVIFDDGSRVILPQDKLIPRELARTGIDGLTVDPHELVFQLPDRQVFEVPWTVIRSLSDPEFNRHLVKAAEEEARQIGLRIKELREARGMSSRELAERAGLTPQSVSRIENGRHDVVFTSLRKILAAMNCSLKDLTVSVRQPTTWDGFIRLTSRLGLPSEFVNQRLAPEAKEDAPIAETVSRISKVYGWSIRSILEGLSLPLNLAPLGDVRYKRFGRASEIRSNAYALYAHWLALKAVEATPEIRKRTLPNDPRKLRKEILAGYGELNLRNLISYLWESGCVVIPLGDAGGFHGACWKIGDRVAIVVKQQAFFLARWLYDLSHETGHVAKHITDATPTVIEAEEISPFSDEDEEIEASEFAEELLFEGRTEELADLCVKEAKNDLRMLKSAVLRISQKENIAADLLANYLAFRLAHQGENWWGAANNLQISEPSPLTLARNEFMKRVNLDKLDEQDRRIVVQALS